MAIRFDASGDSLSRARLAGAKTVMGWVYITTDRNDYTVFFGLGSNELIGTTSDGTTLIFYDGSFERTGAALSTGTWYHLAYVSAGDDQSDGFTVYLNGASSITSSARSQDVTGTNMYLGNDEYSEWLNGRLAHVRVWNAALSADEVVAEMYSFRPQRLANLWSWLPMIDTGTNRSSEWSGSGNTWTANGTLADEDGPAVVANNLPFWSVPWVVAAATGGNTYNLTMNAAGATATPDTATLTIASVVSLTLSAQGATSTPDAALAVLRNLAGSATAITRTTVRHGVRFYGNATGQIDRLRIEVDNPADPPIDVGAGDFCYEFWMRCAFADNATTATDEDARYSNIILDRDIWAHERGWVLGVTRNAGATALVVCFGVAGAGLSWTTIYGTSNVGDGRWHHIALTRSTSTVRLFVDGVQEATGTYSGDLSYPNTVRPAEGQDNPYLVIGTEKHDVGYGYDGEFAAFRVSDVARYTSGFTPPQVVGIDGDTMALFLFEEQTGTTAADTSGLAGAENAELLVGGTPTGPAWTAGGPAALVLVKATVFAATIGTATSDADLAVLRGLTAAAAGVTATPDTATLAVLRSLTGNATALTATNAAALAVLRTLAQAATGATATGDADLAVLRALAQAATGATDTAPVDLAVLRTLAQAVVAASNTAGASAAVLRPLAGNAVAATTTPDGVTLNLAAILALAMSASGGTATNAAALAVLRSLEASATAATNTEAADLAVLRSLTADVTGATATNTAALAVLRMLAQAATTGTATPDDVTLNLTAVIALALAAQSGTATNAAALAVLRSVTATAQGGTDTASATLAVLRSLISGATTGSATPDTVTLNLAAILALALAATTGTSTPDADLAVLRSLTGQATAASDTAGAILTALRSLTSDAQVGSVTEAAELAVLRDAYHGAVAGTATNDAVDFRTVAIIGLLRLVVTGALQPSAAASALRPTITASGRRPSIESGE